MGCDLAADPLPNDLHQALDCIHQPDQVRTKLSQVRSDTEAADERSLVFCLGGCNWLRDSRVVRDVKLERPIKASGVEEHDWLLQQARIDNKFQTGGGC